MIRTPIIILNWNGLSDTTECMMSLSHLDTSKYEVILVDNGSSIQEQEKLHELYGASELINLIINDHNKGFTKGNSDIVENLFGGDNVPEYIVLLNNDTVIHPDWVDQLIICAEEQEADIVSSKMINYYDRRVIDNLGHFMLNTGEILPLGHRQPHEQYTEIFENIGACGGAVLYRTQMIKEIGFFDPYFNTGYEDAELGLRAHLLGYRCIFCPTAIVFHKVSRSIKKIRDNSYLQKIQRNIFYTYIKLMPRRFLLINSLFLLLKYFMWFVFGVFSLQWQLIKLHGSALYSFLRSDLAKARSARNDFYSKYDDRIKYRNSLSGPTRFFALTDLKRILFKLNPE